LVGIFDTLDQAFDAYRAHRKVVTPRFSSEHRTHVERLLALSERIPTQFTPSISLQGSSLDITRSIEWQRASLIDFSGEYETTTRRRK
jgi:hypothetical protein